MRRDECNALYRFATPDIHVGNDGDSISLTSDLPAFFAMLEHGGLNIWPAIASPCPPRFLKRLSGPGRMAESMEIARSVTWTGKLHLKTAGRLGRPKNAGV